MLLHLKKEPKFLKKNKEANKKSIFSLIFNKLLSKYLIKYFFLKKAKKEKLEHQKISRTNIIGKRQMIMFCGCFRGRKDNCDNVKTSSLLADKAL